MPYLVENVRVLVQVGRYTSNNLYVPEYELAVLRAEHGDRVGTPTRLPKPGSKAAKCRVTGRPDHFAALRFTHVESLPLEYERLHNRYSRSEHDDRVNRDESAPVQAVYPTFEVFAQAAKAAYPEVFGNVDIKREVILDADDEDDGEEIVPLADIPTGEEPPVSDEYEQEGPDVGALESLPYIDHGDAVDLYNAGFVTLEDVANGSPEAIASAVRGVGNARAKEIIEVALDQTLGAE